jgi:P27 family predicted phage terminase small subunit
MCQQAKDAWHSYWEDVVSGVMRSSDEPLVTRWIKNVDRYFQVIGEADKRPAVPGSAGQIKANPLYDLALKFEASIKDDEKQLGIGPLNRLRLGVALNEQTKSLAELNAEAADEEDDFRTSLGPAVA